MIIAQYSFKWGSKIKQICTLGSCFSNALKKFLSKQSLPSFRVLIRVLSKLPNLFL